MRRGLAPSRAAAQALVARGEVLVAGAPVDRPTRQVAAGEAIVVTGPPPRFVSRGGEKLDAALTAFAIDVTGMRVLDAGASTGGFTDCVLQRGAAEVVALDVGHGQLHERLRADARVDVRERLNVREVTPATIGGPADLVVADLSFISLRTVAPALVGLARIGGSLVLLVKPQFEAGRQEVARGRGVIRDPSVRRRTLEEVTDRYAGLGADIMGIVRSPITGAEGNVEYLLHARAPGAIPPGAAPPASPAAMIDAVIALDVEPGSNEGE